MKSGSVAKELDLALYINCSDFDEIWKTNERVFKFSNGVKPQFQRGFLFFQRSLNRKCIIVPYTFNYKLLNV